jgi:hypothetical protein
MFTAIQPSLFPEFGDEIINNADTFHLKCYDDPTFSVEVNVADDSTPEEAALERLGYFLVANQA